MKNLLPLHESLKNTTYRVIPFFNDIIGHKIQMGKKVLIVAHESTLRAIVKYLDIISDDKFIELNIPSGVPLVYELDRKLNPINRYYIGGAEKIKKIINVIKKRDSLKDKI